MSFYDGKTVVVTGGGGFLGSHLCDRLSRFKCEVYAPALSEGVDLRKYDTCLNYFRKISPDLIFNCAGDQGGIKYYEGREGTVYLDNLLMGAFQLEAARTIGVKKYVNIIPNCTYPGYLDNDTMREEELWDGQLHDSVLSYGFSKKAQIVQGWAYRKQFGFNSIHLILTNMYGPRDHFSLEKSHALAALLLKFYQAKRNGLPTVEVWGTGQAIREWLYIEDAVEGILLAGEKYNDIKPLNIAVGSGISISELAGIIKNVSHFDGRIVFNHNMPSGAMKKVLSVVKMKEKLNWIPKTTIDRGIQLTLSWLEKNYESIRSF